VDYRATTPKRSTGPNNASRFRNDPVKQLIIANI
jgi:hypothetical protein